MRFCFPRLRLLLVWAGLAGRMVAGPWEPLFNGQDLTGWKVINGTAPFAVVDGAIMGTTVAGSPNSFLATEKSYGDFIFECEIRQEDGRSNSGVQFRSHSGPEFDSGRVYGYQLDIDPTARAWSGGLYDEARRGWLYPASLNPAAQSAYVYGEWNRLRIEAIGPSLRTWVNDVPVAAVMDDLTPAGFFALQIHGIGEKPAEAGRKVYWRNLRVQTTDLVPSPPADIFVRNVQPNELSDAERTQGWRLLWDGKTTAGWRGASTTEFPAAGWSRENGTLTVAGGKGSDILTEEEFAAFDFQCEFKLTEGANSGIKYFVTTMSEGVLGLEYQLLDDARHPDAKNGRDGNRTQASLYDLIPRAAMPESLGIKPVVGEWQHARIVARPDGHVEHWLNGIKVVEYQRGSPAFAELVTRSKYAQIPGFGLAAKGRILLQQHGDIVHFRSLKVRTLTAR